MPSASMPAKAPIVRDIVLVGGGHSHVGVLMRFAMHPEPGVCLTVICRDTDTPYSGMLPGYVAGHYTFDDVHIDLRRLCQFAGARFYRDHVIDIDRQDRRVLCANRPPVNYDVLSINIGSTPRLDHIEGIGNPEAHDAPVVAVKPISTFQERWIRLLARARAATSPLDIVLVGGGAGGVELLLAIQQRLVNEMPAGLAPRLTLITRGKRLLPTHTQAVGDALADTLAARGITVHFGEEITAVETHTETQQRQLISASGAAYRADEAIWVTRAGGARWLSRTGLSLDDDGFLKVRDTLQTLDDDAIFAAGDIAHQVNHPREKAGVFAVRQSRPLADNLRRAVRGEPLKDYLPQPRWLALISTGDRNAIASRGSLGLVSPRLRPWLWRWKDHIDRQFMTRFNDLPSMQSASNTEAGSGMSELGERCKNAWQALSGPSKKLHPHLTAELDEQDAHQALSALAMRCGGCGAKVGANVLSRALGSLAPRENEDVLVGLHAPDDAAIVRIPKGQALVHSVDFFRAFIDDPYLFGRVAANHALGDLYAMGARPHTATAIATVPQGVERKIEPLVRELMQGATEVLNEAGCSLVGGHTGEGQELALGFALNGLVDESLTGVTCKGGMRPGDVIILTKAIGTGTLLAAHARLVARGRWIDAALVSMQQSSQQAADILRRHHTTASTDITGFGLLGHLVEMTRASGVDAELDIAALPILEGAEECVARGVVSSLQPANLRLKRALKNQQALVDHPRYPLLFDPQTAGGLLASIPLDQSEACLAALKAAGYSASAIIGRVKEHGDALAPISVTR
ncbi:selenide, water dikinase SelD [Cobetia sp. L2A1]|uniref:selenide, water dikinase SelD n=1 Tax=Cobetia sp. L2A1 TaxID=2686360 RepID=UPI0018EEEAE1|nr:selenide, water dikinase SelD [Cobetia sp. L2A1]